MDEPKRRIWKVDGYTTLPLIISYARTVTALPAFGTGRAVDEYCDPEYEIPPCRYSTKWLAKVAKDADLAEKVTLSWSNHFCKLAYYLQFRDDLDAERFKAFRSHTELVTAILETRLHIRCEPLWETFDWLVEFKFVQEAYRKDDNRAANYEQHARKLAKIEKDNCERHKSSQIISRARDKIRVHVTEWPKMYGLKSPVVPTKTDKRLSLFYSYSHADETLREELVKHLMALQRQGEIDQWHDRRIGAGCEWAGEIDRHLEEADIILLLISSDFLASNYCYDLEMKRAIERHERGEAFVIPVFLRPCDWQGCPFAKLQGLPKDAVPITSWDDRDVAFTDVSRGIRSRIQSIKQTRTRSENGSASSNA